MRLPFFSGPSLYTYGVLHNDAVDGNRQNGAISGMIIPLDLHHYAAKDLYISSANEYFGVSGKNYKIHCLIIDRVTLLHIQQYPSVLEPAMITKSWHAAAVSWSFIILQKISPTVALNER